MLKREKKDAERVLRDNVFSAYEEIAKTYRRGLAWTELLSGIVMERDGLVLDAGCGSGLHSLFLARQGFRVVALDISSGMVKRLLKTVRRKKLDIQIDCVAGDMRFLPFRSYLFDYAVAIASIHHIPLHTERSKAIEEICRVLKEGGLLIASVWNLLQPSLLLRAFKAWITGRSFEFGDIFASWRTKNRKVERFYHLFTKKELRDLIKACGKLKVRKLYGWSPKKSLIARNFVVEAIKNDVG